MAPSEHLDWLDENTDWFLSLPPESLDTQVPSCPGWNIEKVITHLAFGLGLGYPYALSAPPEAAADQALAEVPWPSQMPSGQDALEALSFHMSRCIKTFRATNPLTPCWTYDGPGQASFWFRRAAIETTLHRMDVSDALLLGATELADVRAVDTISEAVEFALPLAARMIGTPDAAMAIKVAGDERVLVLGEGEIGAEITGGGTAVLSALWGRKRSEVHVLGDERIAQSWLSVIESAFAGR